MTDDEYLFIETCLQVQHPVMSVNSSSILASQVASRCLPNKGKIGNYAWAAAQV